MPPQKAPTITEAIGDEQILATRDVMLQLRTSVARDEYLPTIRKMMQEDGYHLVALYDEGAVRAVAGYRFMQMLNRGKIMYIDDLNTDHRHRSFGYGKALLEWLKAEAKERVVVIYTWIRASNERTRIDFTFARA